MQALTTNTSTASIKRDFVSMPPRIGDRVTFKTPDDGTLVGFVSAFRSHLGNGERFAWVELDNGWCGTFRGVPLRDIESADDFGFDRDLDIESQHDFRKMYLCDFSSMAAASAENRCFDI